MSKFEMISVEVKKATCDCGHSWITKSQALKVSCPRCCKKVRIREDERLGDIISQGEDGEDNSVTKEDLGL